MMRVGLVAACAMILCGCAAQQAVLEPGVFVSDSELSIDATIARIESRGETVDDEARSDPYIVMPASLPSRLELRERQFELHVGAGTSFETTLTGHWRRSGDQIILTADNEDIDPNANETTLDIDESGQLLLTLGDLVQVLVRE